MIPAFARMLVSEAKSADPAAYASHRLLSGLLLSSSFFSIIMKVPAAISTRPASPTEDSLSEKMMKDRMTVSIVLDLSTGTTLLT